MKNKYFRIVDAFDLPNRWYLGSPCTADGLSIDPRSFTEGRIYKGENKLYIPITRGSVPLDFTLGSFDMPVIVEQVARSLESAKLPIQWIDARVIGSDAVFKIGNVRALIRGINEDASEITRWTMEDGFPGRCGQYAGIGRLVLDRDAVKHASIFRLKDWELSVIVSESVVEILVKEKASGIQFEEIEAL